MGAIAEMAGKLEDAGAEYERASSLLRDILVTRPGDTETRFDLSRTLLDQSLVAQQMNGMPAALSFVDASLVERRAVVNAQRDANHVTGLAATLLAKSDLLVQHGDLEEATRVTEEALAAAEQATALEPDSTRARRARLKTLMALAERRAAKGDRAGAAEVQQQVVAESRLSVQRDPGDAVAQRDLASALIFLAKELSATGKKVEALAAIDEARAGLEKVMERDESGQVRRDLIVVLVREGYVSLVAKEPARAAKAFTRVRELGRELLRADEKNTTVLDAMVDAANGLGEAALATGDLSRARREAEEAQAVNERLIALAGAADARLEARRGIALTLLARVLAVQGERAKACATAKQALFILEPLLAAGRASAATQESIDEAKAVCR